LLAKFFLASATDEVKYATKKQVNAKIVAILRADFIAMNALKDFTDILTRDVSHVRVRKQTKISQEDVSLKIRKFRASAKKATQVHCAIDVREDFSEIHTKLMENAKIAIAILKELCQMSVIT
jgi:hypothetical protein